MKKNPQVDILYLAIFLFILSVAVFYPGFMSEDSIAQLVQAREGVYSDGHPPIMAFIWRQLDRLISGPPGMLALQLFLYWTGLYLITSALRMNFRAGAGFLIVVGLYPGFLGILGVIWKDIFLMSSLVMATASCLMFARSHKVFWFFLGIAFLFIGCAFRINGVLAMPPLLIWMMMNLFEHRWSPYKRLLVSSVISILISFSFVFTNSYVNREILKAQVTHPWKLLAVYDIAGVYYNLGQIPPDIKIPMTTQPMTMDVLKKDYTSRSLMNLVIPHCDTDNKCRRPLFDFGNEYSSEGQQNLKDLHEFWFQSIKSHPISYLKHRWAVFREVTGMTDIELWMVTYFRIVDNNLGISLQKTAVQTYLEIALNSISHTFWFKAWIFLILNLVLLYKGIQRWRADKPAPGLAVLMSAFFYEMGYLLFAPSPDYRYSLWFMVGTLIAAFLFWRNILIERDLTLLEFLKKINIRKINGKLRT